MRIIALMCLLLASSCTSKFIVSQSAKPDINVELIDVKKFTNQKIKWSVVVKFNRVSARQKAYEYTHVVQEILLDNGDTVVESFRLSNNTTGYDTHTYTSDKSVRILFVYLATVIDSDETNGFAMLPHNKCKSIYTTTGINFNYNYRINHNLNGKIIADAREYGFVWIIAYNDEIEVSLQ